ncbi:hypothetical protein BGY98DRAFT_1185018 [Russula aff. rugulosa BPL654]|nr:hypothetical protein BGY98DRAFT_1185018 [Russula aff. rugulosa BPL654]
MDTTSPESGNRLRVTRQLIIDEVISPSEASTGALKSRHNERAPISQLPCAVLTTIFSLLSVFAWNEGSGILAWIYVSHVCRRWRETALNHSHFWSHINFTRLTPAGMAEILSRAKTAPLHLEAYFYRMNMERFEDLGKQLEAHIFHTRYLKLSGCHLSTVVKRLVSSTPTLESLTFLTSLRLQQNCDIGWKSPLFKGLRILEILEPSEEARPELNDWLDALNEMPQLKELSLRSATPVAPHADPLISPSVSRTVTLPSLTYFYIGASAEDCALALAHLVLPTLTQLHIDIKSHNWDGEDVLLAIPYIVRKCLCPAGHRPIRSILIAGERKRTEVVTWTTPGADVKTAISDALLTLLPTDSVSTLTAQNRTRLSKGFWLRHASGLRLLEQARLVPTAVRAFKEMLSEDIPFDSDCPQFPFLTKLILLDVRLTLIRTLHLRDTLIERVEQGVPLEYLDLRTCVAPNRAIQLLAEIVVDVREPLVEFDDGRGSWYDDTDSGEDEDGDEDDSEDEDGMDFNSFMG